MPDPNATITKVSVTFVTPGRISNTSMPKRTSSARSASIRPQTANLLAEYSVQNGIETGLSSSVSRRVESYRRSASGAPPAIR